MQGSSETSNWNFDVLQTLVRAALKIGGGFLLAKGITDESTLESLTAGAVALAAIIWGVRHRTSRGSTSPGSLPSAPLFILALLVWGCASLTTRAFRDEKADTDAAYASMKNWQAYFASAVTNAPSAERATLTNRNAEVKDASRAFAASMTTAETLRQNCETNSSPTNRTALDLALAVAHARSSNLVWLVSTRGAGGSPASLPRN